MPSNRPADRFSDIIVNIDAIGRYVAGMTKEQFCADEKTIDATERCLSEMTIVASR